MSSGLAHPAGETRRPWADAVQAEAASNGAADTAREHQQEHRWHTRGTSTASRLPERQGGGGPAKKPIERVQETRLTRCDGQTESVVAPANTVSPGEFSSRRNDNKNPPTATSGSILANSQQRKGKAQEYDRRASPTTTAQSVDSNSATTTTTRTWKPVSTSNSSIQQQQQQQQQAGNRQRQQRDLAESYLQSDVITTQPTLSPTTVPPEPPRVSNSNNTTASTQRRSAAGGRNPEPASASQQQEQGGVTIRTNVSNGDKSNGHSAGHELSGLNMGYTTSSARNLHNWIGMETINNRNVNDHPSEDDDDEPCRGSTNEGKHRETDDDTTVQSFDSATIGSPAMASVVSTLLDDENDHDDHGVVDHQQQQEHTPSTVSTALSTDEASSYADVQLAERSGLNQMSRQQQQHQRTPSWEASPRQAAAVQQQQFFGDHHAFSPTNVTLPPAYASHGPWGQQSPRQHSAMVASFRCGDPQQQPQYYVDNRWNQQQQEQHQHMGLPHPHHPPQVQRFPGAPQLPFLPGRGGTPPIDNRGGGMHQRPPHHQGGYSAYAAAASARGNLRGNPPAAGPYGAPHPHHHQSPVASPMQQQHHPRVQSIATSPRGTSTTPTRGDGQHQRLPPGAASSPHHRQGQSQGGPGSGSSGGGSRSSSEVLKTLLRKKACLYEPDTSRAVALVTWLVGRELALDCGYFSRQQLQAGVHACVAEMISSGSITRTKVNRCMQIILNSCFHYIIPRPDGTEENGDWFRMKFAGESKDDSFLLQMLPEPWNSVVVDKEEILKVIACEQEPKAKKQGSGMETPQASPRLGSMTPDKGSPGGRETGADDDDSHKRAVLLCFNENVRCAEDVFRCHNEFIRDTAHASHLQLSSQEWRFFFGPEAAVAPYIWGNIGIPVPYSEVHGSSHVDALGMMTTYEAGKFRTSWCTKRYDHDRDLCGFAHIDVNGGWLRRNPSVHRYKDEMCPSVTTISEKQIGPGSFVLNECPDGVNCTYAHSQEEIMYHPHRYKMSACPSSGRSGGCNLGDVCPSFHPADSYRFPKKSDGRSSRHSKHPHHSSGGGGSKVSSSNPPPAGSPLLLASPAPLSSFEEHLQQPGLQNLFRRQCSVVRAHLRKSGTTCYYSYFGDDAGSIDAADVQKKRVITTKPFRGLPTPLPEHRPPASSVIPESD